MSCDWLPVLTGRSGGEDEGAIGHSGVATSRPLADSDATRRPYEASYLNALTHPAVAPFQGAGELLPVAAVGVAAVDRQVFGLPFAPDEEVAVAVDA